MHRILLAASTALLTTACAGPSVRDVLIPTFTYRPSPTDLVSVVDSPADIRTCRRLGVVSPTVSTGPSFDADLQAMLDATVALQGTHLWLQRVSTDWSVVRGVAYDCNPRLRERSVIRAKG
jgi:hypothetical protein